MKIRDGGNPPGGAIACSGGPPCVTSPGTGDNCIISFQVTGEDAHAWKIAVPGDTLSNYGTGSSTLGGGLLDNLRGQCGVITDWQANSDDNNNLAVSFATTIFCGSDDVNNAIWLANGMNYAGNCEYDDADPDGDAAEGAIGALEGLFEAFGEN